MSRTQACLFSSQESVARTQETSFRGTDPCLLHRLLQIPVEQSRTFYYHQTTIQYIPSSLFPRAATFALSLFDLRTVRVDRRANSRRRRPVKPGDPEMDQMAQLGHELRVWTGNYGEKGHYEGLSLDHSL